MIKGKKGLVVAFAAAMLLPVAAFAQDINVWAGNCTEDDLLATEGGYLASIGPLIHLPNSWAQFDIDADGVPDAWQCQLISYAICQGNQTVIAGEAANEAATANLISQFTTLVTYIGSLQDNGGTHHVLTDFAATVAASPACDNPAGLPSPLNAYWAAAFGAAGMTHISQAYAYVGGQLNSAYGNYNPFPAVLGLIPHVLAALGGMSSEGATVINGIVPTSSVATLEQALQILQGIAQYEAACGAGTGNAALAAAASSVATAIGTPPPLSPLSLQVLSNGAKSTGDFAGGGDYNGDGLTNHDVAADVQAAGGGANDFVAGATGDFPFWAGNPFLPVAGLFGLAAAVGGLGAAGALRLRRRA